MTSTIRATCPSHISVILRTSEATLIHDVLVDRQSACDCGARARARGRPGRPAAHVRSSRGLNDTKRNFARRPEGTALPATSWSLSQRLFQSSASALPGLREGCGAQRSLCPLPESGRARRTDTPRRSATGAPGTRPLLMGRWMVVPWARLWHRQWRPGWPQPALACPGASPVQWRAG